MSDTLEVFMAYANDFEKTFHDDDWSRLNQYFAPDAVYNVVGGHMACRIEGREAILAGLKKSLDTLDRLCSDRKIELRDGPHIEPTAAGEQISMSWAVDYQYRDAPRVKLPGSSVAVIENGLITRLQDTYIEEELVEFQQWMQEYGAELSGRYV